MKSTQASQEEINTTYANLRRKLFSPRFFTLMLMLALCLASVRATASAQTCWEDCQRNLANCLLAAAGDPAQEVRCQNNYDKCGQDCM